MVLTSFAFLIFFTITLGIYYLVPGKLQWLLLLGASFVYVLFSDHPELILFPLVAVTVTWGCLQLLSKIGEDDGSEAAKEKHTAGKRKAVLIADLLILLGILFVFKYSRFVQGQSGGLQMAAPLGLSFYTFILAGYFIDVYNGISKSETNWGKVALYGMYFPLMTSGPVVSYREEEGDFFTRHKLEYNNLVYGVQRILWGFFKELVISERLSKVVSTVFNNHDSYPGAYIWVGVLCFTLQLYTNFSGCMDIVLGVSECFGQQLPENFDTPFFAKSISEYWRRWHATLGVWMKDHVFYPLLRTKMFIQQGKWLRKKCGKKLGKNLNTWGAMFILWFSIGLWHGGDFKYVIGSGLLHWFYIVIGEATLPFWVMLCGKLHLNMQSKGMDVFRVLRTFFLVNIGNTFFRADSTGHAIAMLKQAFSVWNPGVLVDGSILELGMSLSDWLVVTISLLFVLVTSILQYRMADEAQAKGETYTYHALREKMAAQPLPIRWGFWMAFLFLVILWGQYGPDFSAAEFIYAGF